MHRTAVLAVAFLAAITAALWFASPTLAEAAASAPSDTETNGGVASIELRVTVAASELCGTDESITVSAGDHIYFCYTVLNTGSKTLRYHSLTDSAFGPILSNVEYRLSPRASFELIKGPYAASQSFTNHATWSAASRSNSTPVSANDSISVTVLTPEPERAATLTVAHFAPFAASVDGTSVSVKVNGQVVFTDFKFGDVKKNVELPAGDYFVEVVPTGATEAAISGNFTLEAGVDYTLAAIGDGKNQHLELLPFVDDNRPADSGAKVRIAHLSPFAADSEQTKVDICTDDGTAVVEGLAYKGVVNPVLPAGDYNLKIAVAGSNCTTVALDLPSIRLADGDIFELYAIGIPGGSIAFTVAAHPDLVLTPEPEKARITIALNANPDSPRNFRFEGDLGRFRLDDAGRDDGDAYTNSKSFEVEPGVYDVKQLAPYRWTLSSIQCEGGSSSVDLANSSVAITAAAGDEITCTFMNQRNTFLRINKYLDQDSNGRRHFEGGLEGFEFKLYDSTGNLVDTQVSNKHGKAHFNHLAPGDYEVCETPKDGWTNTQPGGDGCYTIAAGPKLIYLLRFGNSPGGTVTATAVQDATSDIEVHADEYIDHDDENYFLTTPFVDADLNAPAITGKLFLSMVMK